MTFSLSKPNIQVTLSLSGSANQRPIFPGCAGGRQDRGEAGHHAQPRVPGHHSRGHRQEAAGGGGQEEVPGGRHPREARGGREES